MMDNKLYEAFVSLFAEIVRSEIDRFDDLVLFDSTAGRMIFSQHKFNTPEAEDAAWEHFWAEAEKAFAILFKENINDEGKYLPEDYFS